MEGNVSGNSPLDDEIVEEAASPDGIQVVLFERIWRDKILRDHPEIAPFVEAVLNAISAPDHVETDPVRDDRTRYFVRDVGPSRWMVVVVSYEQAPARIISAFAHRKDPPAWSA